MARSVGGGKGKRSPRSHRRRHSVAGTGAGGGVVGSSGDGGASFPSPSAASSGRRVNGRIRSRPGSVVSSVASSGLRSESDSGSVLRLYDDYRGEGGDRRQSQEGWGTTVRRVDVATLGEEDEDEDAGAVAGVKSRGGSRNDLVVGGDQLTRSRLAQVFEGAAYASSEGHVSRASPSSSTRRANASPPPRERDTGSPEPSWPWVAGVRRDSSSPLIGMENSLASESELGASETSDWDQVCDVCVVCVIVWCWGCFALLRVRPWPLSSMVRALLARLSFVVLSL